MDGDARIGRRWRCRMRIFESFFRFSNAMYLGMMFEKLLYSELLNIDKVLTTLNVIALIMWLLIDIKRMKIEVQE